MLRKFMRLLLVAAVVGTAAVSVSSSGASSGKKPKPNSLNALIAQSKKESGLVIYGNPPAANFSALIDKFSHTYPWIKVTPVHLDDYTIFSKYGSEAAQGAPTADVLIASAPNLWVYAARQGYAAHFTPLGINKYPKFVQQYKGIFVMSPDPTIIVYNKLLLKGTPPSSLTQIANDPKTYPKVTGYTVDNTFGYTGLYGYVQLRGWKNFTSIGRRLSPTADVASQLQLVAQGGADLTYLTSPTAEFAIESNSQLQNILGWSYVKDGEPLVPRGFGVTAKAHDPASARLFVDWVYSTAGQQAMCDSGFTAFRNGYKPADGCQRTLAAVYAAVGKKNTYMPGFTQKFVNDRPGFTKHWHAIFG